MSITTARDARSFVGHVTMHSATSPAGSAGRSSATRAGRGSTALNQSVYRDVMRSMGFVTSLGNANAELASLESTVMTVSATLAACMVPVSNHGSATAKKAGVVSSATKILITAHTTNHVRMELLAPTPAKEATPVPADLGSLEQAVRLRSMSALTTPALMEEAALIWRTHTTVPVRLDTTEETVS